MKFIGFDWEADRVVHAVYVDEHGESVAINSARIVGKTAYGFGTMRTKDVPVYEKTMFVARFEELCKKAGAEKLIGTVPEHLADSYCQQYGFTDTGKREEGPSGPLWIIVKDLTGGIK